MTDLITIALPKGRIALELAPVLARMDIEAEADFFDASSRKLMFATSRDDVRLIRVRSFDVPTFVSRGAAHIGVCGSDVLAEHDYPEIYAPIDLAIGKCRMSLALPVGVDVADIYRSGHIQVATKYTHITKNYFAEKGIQAECIKLNGAMELAPMLGLACCIVDLVSTGNTLKANGLVESESMMEISSRLIVNRPALKTDSKRMNALIEGFKQAIGTD